MQQVAAATGKDPWIDAEEEEDACSAEEAEALVALSGAGEGRRGR
jgi:hypothetical protein